MNTSMRFWLGLCVLAWLGARSCKGEPPDVRPALASETPPPVAAGVAQQCGLSCRGDQHIEKYLCAPGCGPCTQACQHNAVDCEANVGEHFDVCGVGPCPDGYHAESHGRAGNDCDACKTSDCEINQTHCALHDPNRAFDVCGTGCPAGFEQLSFAFEPKCVSDCSGSAAPNMVRCKRSVVQPVPPP